MKDSRNFWMTMGVIFAVAMPHSAQPQTATYFSDTVMSQWTIAYTVKNLPNNQIYSTYIPSGGYGAPPSSYRWILNSVGMDHIVESYVLGVHLYGTASDSYDPNSVPIASISFSIRSRCPIAGGQCGGKGQEFGPAIYQAPYYYVANGHSGLTGTAGTWNFFAASELTAQDFNRVVPGGPIDAANHPHFETGANPIRCGFYTTDSNEPLGIPYSTDGGYDEWTCRINLVGELSVTKIAPDPLNVLGNQQFPTTITCSKPGFPQSIYALSVHANTSAAPITGILTGSNCSVTEKLPFPPRGCVWAPPQYSPQPIHIAGGLNHVTVTNRYLCRTGSLIFRKIIAGDPPPFVPPDSFQAAVTCTDPLGQNTVYQVNVPTGGASMPLAGLVVGSTCHIDEHLPPPFSYGGKVCVWQPPAYVLAQDIVIANGPLIVKIVNSYRCG